MANQSTPKTATATKASPQAGGIRSTNHNYRPIASTGDARMGGQAEQSTVRRAQGVEANGKTAPKGEKSLIYVTFVDKIKALCDVCEGAKANDELLKVIGFEQRPTRDKAVARMFALIQKSSITDRVQLGSHKRIVKRIMTLVDGDTLNDILDLLYNYIHDIETLKDVIDKRFGVPVGSARADRLSMGNVLKLKDDMAKAPSGQAEQNWTVNGLVHVYSVYLNIPQHHLDMIRCLMTFNTHEVADSSGALHRAGIYYVSYSDTFHNHRDGEKTLSFNQEGKEGYWSCSHGDEGDMCRGMVSIDQTIAHELGHIVDTRRGYTEKFDAEGAAMPGSILQISGWRRHQAGNREKLVDYIISQIDEPYSSDSNDDVKALTRSAAKIMLRDRATTDETRKISVYRAFDGQTGDNLTDEKEKKEGDAGARTGKAITKVTEAPLLDRIQHAFSENRPWYLGERFSNMKRQIHEGYSGEWFSYANDAWDNNKFSSYQFRAPCEEFAEIYGSYFSATPNGSRTPKAFKKWFEAQKLHLSVDGSKPKGNAEQAKAVASDKTKTSNQKQNVPEWTQNLINLQRRKGK